MPWEVLYLLVFAGFVWLLDRDIDPYPPPLPKSANPRREFGIVLLLWGMALGVNAFRLSIVDPWFMKTAIHPALGELINLLLLTLPFLALPLYLSIKIDGYTLADLGLTWKSRSAGVTIFALAFGAISGAVAFWTGETVVGLEALSAGALVLLVYNNAFLEEFFYRGVIQNRLERVFGQRRAVLAGGFLFAMAHVVLDVRVLAGEGGMATVLVALLMQTLGGLLLGLIFVKTRTLWPGVACHYLINWLPSILSLLAGR
jgi:membrane protease YdiL (CAAX protease family)